MRIVTGLAFMLLADRLGRIADYVEQTSQRHGYDRSHNLVHSMDVLTYTHHILESDPALISVRREPAYAAALLHDMIDHKYRDDESAAAEEVRYFLEHDLRYGMEDVNFMMLIMGTMSHSKTIRNNVYIEPPWLRDPSVSHDYVHTFHAVRQADLLTSYDIERMLSYKHCRGNLTVEDAVAEAVRTFNSRILALRRINGLFPSPWARHESGRLEQLALERMALQKRFTRRMCSRPIAWYPF